MQSATDLWTGNFGNDYTKRQMDTCEARRYIWGEILPFSSGSILEVGANVGSNLAAIESLGDFTLFATEPNKQAFRQLISKGICATDNVADNLESYADGMVDLVFTSGVLIHVPPERLKASLSEIHRVARRYIIAAEYFAPQEEMIPYRGHDNALWRRDYGSLYLDQFPDLRCISCTFAWKRTTGLDNLTVWVFEKQGAKLSA